MYRGNQNKLCSTKKSHTAPHSSGTCVKRPRSDPKQKHTTDRYQKGESYAYPHKNP